MISIKVRVARETYLPIALLNGVSRKELWKISIKLRHIVLQQLSRCVVCHREYEVSDITSVQRKPGVWTLMVECDQCHSRNYIAAVTAEGSAEDAMLEVRSLTQRAMRVTIDPPMRKVTRSLPKHLSLATE